MVFSALLLGCSILLPSTALAADYVPTHVSLPEVSCPNPDVPDEVDCYDEHPQRFHDSLVADKLLARYSTLFGEWSAVKPRASVALKARMASWLREARGFSYYRNWAAPPPGKTYVQNSDDIDETQQYLDTLQSAERDIDFALHGCKALGLGSHPCKA